MYSCIMCGGEISGGRLCKDCAAEAPVQEFSFEVLELDLREAIADVIDLGFTVKEHGGGYIILNGDEVAGSIVEMDRNTGVTWLDPDTLFFDEHVWDEPLDLEPWNDDEYFAPDGAYSESWERI